MQMLWAAELQSRQFGVCGSSDPFDHAQLPLLATMQFDGFMHKGGSTQHGVSVSTQASIDEEVEQGDHTSTTVILILICLQRFLDHKRAFN